MPILHITIDQSTENRPIQPRIDPAEVFAVGARVPAQYVTVNITQSAHQSGNAYKAMVQLVLPDLLLPEARERMLQAAVDMLRPCFGIDAEEVVAWLTVLPSKHVLDRGQFQEWENTPPTP